MEYFTISNILLLGALAILLVTVLRLQTVRKEVATARKEVVDVFKDLHQAEADRDSAMSKLSGLQQTLIEWQGAYNTISDPKMKRLPKANPDRQTAQANFDGLSERLNTMQSSVGSFLLKRNS